MGPKLISKVSEKTGIAYSWRLLPFGGFVAMVGEDEESADERAFCRKPVWQRIIITAAGSFMNIVLGVVITFIMVVSSSAIGGTTVADFDDNAVSVKGGLQAGDEILSIDGVRVHISSQLIYEISRCTDGPVNVEVKRGSENVTLESVEFGTETQEGILFGRCDFTIFAVPKTFGNVLSHTFYGSGLFIKEIWQSVGDLISGRYGVDAVSGPVGVTSAITQVAKKSPTSLLMLIAVIAMNLGIFNMLPIPALDGGKIFFLLIELIFRKPVSRKVEGYIHTAGMIILFSLLIFITVKDVYKLILK